MNRLALLLFFLVCAGCTTPQRHHALSPRYASLPQPNIDDFTAHLTYPYYAPHARQQQIEQAAHLLHKGMTEADVLAVIGPPDYKAAWFNHGPRGEIWHYVHTWERPIEPDYHGKMVFITFDERVRPRILLDFDAADFGVRQRK